MLVKGQHSNMQGTRNKGQHLHPEAGHILGPRAQGLRGEGDCSEGEAGVAGVVEAVHGEGVSPGQPQPGHRGRGVAGAELQHIGPPVH